jgi:WD40 repeat protein
MQRSRVCASHAHLGYSSPCLIYLKWRETRLLALFPSSLSPLVYNCRNPTTHACDGVGGVVLGKRRRLFGAVIGSQYTSRRGNHTATAVDPQAYLESEAGKGSCFSTFGEGFGCAFSPDGATLATCSGAGVLTLGTVHPRAAVDAIQVHDEIAYDVVWGKSSGGSPTVLTASADRTVRLYDVHRKKLTTEFIGHQSSVKAVATAAHHPSLVLSGGRDGAVVLWDARDHSTHRTLGTAVHARAGRSKSGRWHAPAMVFNKAHCGSDGVVHSVTAVALLPDGAAALSGGADGKIHRWDLRNRKSILFHAPPIQTVEPIGCFLFV